MATITNIIVDVMFTCDCGELLVFIDVNETVVCRKCEKVYNLKLEVTEDIGDEKDY